MDEFTPHGFCLAWEPLLLWVTVVANAGIAWAYFGIAFLLLLAIVYKIAAVPSWLLMMFSGFIFLCGAGHVVDIITLWLPIYWISAIEDAATSLISLATFMLLPVGIAGSRRRYFGKPAGHDPASACGGETDSLGPSAVSTTVAAPVLPASGAASEPSASDPST